MNIGSVVVSSGIITKDVDLNIEKNENLIKLYNYCCGNEIINKEISKQTTFIEEKKSEVLGVVEQLKKELESVNKTINELKTKNNYLKIEIHNKLKVKK